MSSTGTLPSVRMLLREGHERYRAQPPTQLSKPYRKLIAEGIKTVEVRVGYPKMHKIRSGRELTFASADDRCPAREAGYRVQQP